MNWSTEWSKPVIVGIDYGKHELTTARVNIPIPGGWPVEKDLIIIGDLGIHEPINDKRYIPWQVTHLPTLSRFNVFEHLHKQETLIAYCKKVQENLKDDWLMLAKLDNKLYETKDLTPELVYAKDRIWKMCMEVEIND